MHTQTIQEMPVFFSLRVACRQQPVAVKHAVGPRQETQRMQAFGHLFTTRRQTHHGTRHTDAGHGDHAHKIERVDGLAVSQGRAGHAHQAVDGHRLGVRLQVGQLRNQARTVHGRFAHAHDAAAAHADA